ncbi:MAG: gas vesicle protein GvpN [Candidatus Schekmanbacteria bacterium]|nr:gas vesicle protein GvpN [Candidatus Schekmanbacteria bacterium]
MKEQSTATVAAPIQRVQPGHDTVKPQASESFVQTAYVDEIARRALTYLEVGYPVHFAGMAGTGKTTLALHTAALLGRPVALIHGDDQFTSADLIGHNSGFRRRSLVDNYIHSVVKTEEEMRTLWVDNRLTMACHRGYTVVYDEFNRSRPETNNVLLSVLAEGILNMPHLRTRGEGYMHVHSQFRAIFTSNPEEYAGVHKAQDALMDRMITINLGHFDQDTEVQITMSRGGIDRAAAQVIVRIVRALRGVGVHNHRPTIRACIAIGKVLARHGADPDPTDPFFRCVLDDVLLGTDTVKVTRGGRSLMRKKLEEIISAVGSGGDLDTLDMPAGAAPAWRNNEEDSGEE